MKLDLKSLMNESILPLLASVLSVFNIVSHVSNLLSLSVLLSLVGIVSAYFYFKKNEYFRILLLIWVWAQVIIIDRSIIDQATMNLVEKPIWDLAQFTSIKFGFTFSSSTGAFGINFNALSILYFVLLKILEVSGLIGKQFSFMSFRQNSLLKDVLPMNGVALRSLTIANESDWYLVKMESSFVYDGLSIEYVLIRTKEGETIKRNSSGHVVYFRLVPDIQNLSAVNADLSSFPFVDWALCEVVK